MAIAVTTELPIPTQPKSNESAGRWGFLKNLNGVFNKFRSGGNKSSSPATIGLEPISSISKLPQIPPESGYAKLIKYRQEINQKKGKPEMAPDLIANELTQLYGDLAVFIQNSASGIPSNEINNAIQKLNGGDVAYIAELAAKFRDRYIPEGDNLTQITKRVHKGLATGNDLKIVLAHQFVTHLQPLIANQSRVGQASISIKESVPVAVVQGTEDINLNPDA